MVKEGDGVLTGSNSCKIRILFRPSLYFDGDFPEIKFAVDLLEVDETYSDITAKKFWKENVTFSIRKTVPAHINKAEASLKEETYNTGKISSGNISSGNISGVSVKDVSTLLDSLKFRLSNESMTIESLADANLEMKRSREALKQPSGTNKYHISSENIYPYPGTRTLNLLTKSLQPMETLSAEEFEVIFSGTIIFVPYIYYVI